MFDTDTSLALARSFASLSLSFVALFIAPVVELSAVTAARDADEPLLSLRLRLAPDPDPGAAGLAGARLRSPRRTTS